MIGEQVGCRASAVMCPVKIGLKTSPPTNATITRPEIKVLSIELFINSEKLWVYLRNDGTLLTADVGRSRNGVMYIFCQLVVNPTPAMNRWGV